MATSDDFMDRLRQLNQQSRRITTAEGEILNEYVGVEDTFNLADSVTVTVKALGTQGYQWGGLDVPAARRIIWGEWVWRT